MTIGNRTREPDPVTLPTTQTATEGLSTTPVCGQPAALTSPVPGYEPPMWAQRWGRGSPAWHPPSASPQLLPPPPTFKL